MSDRNAYHVNAVKNANPQSHERLGEINHLLALSGNGEAGHGQVCFLEGRESPSEGRPHGTGHQDGDRGHRCWGMLPWSGFSVVGVTLRSSSKVGMITDGHWRLDPSAHCTLSRTKGRKDHIDCSERLKGPRIGVSNGKTGR